MGTKTSIVWSLQLLWFFFLVCFDFIFRVEVADSIVVLGCASSLIIWRFLIFNSALWWWKLGFGWRLQGIYIFMWAFLQLELSFGSIPTKLTILYLFAKVLSWVALFHHSSSYRSDKIIDFSLKTYDRSRQIMKRNIRIIYFNDISPIINFGYRQ